MMKRPFFSLCGPKLKHQAVEDRGIEPKEVGLPSGVTLLVKGCDIGDIDLKVGMPVLTGQRLKLSDDPDGYVISTVTGTISGLSEYTGYQGQGYACISIDVSGADEWDEATLAAIKEPGFEAARGYLGSIAGKSDFSSLLKQEPPVNTVVISGVDQDLLVLTNQLMVQAEGLSEGIEYLKELTRIGRVILAVLPGFSLPIDLAGVVVKEVSPVYPGSLPAMIAKDVLGIGYTPGKGLDEMGIGFVGAEAVTCLAGIFGKGEFCLDKVITVIGKDGEAVLVKARIGTPVGDVLSAVGIEASHGDRVVFGGPMAGKAVYSLDMPVCADTDAVMVQDASDVVLSAGDQCVNCGECVRACPVGVPVNMLVRVLSSSLYEEAADMYDLHCCIECGLCNYVCVAQIPVFHHIMLGKHEIAKIKNAEGSNA